MAVNDGFLVGNPALVSGKFGNALSLDGSGDYVNIPRFSGVHDEGNFTISAWVYPTNLGYDSDVQDAAIFGTEGDDADTVLFWYNVNGASTANRTFTFNIGSMNIGLNHLDGPDGLALQDRWQHLVAVTNGQGRKIYHNGLLIADSIGSDNLVTIEGNNVRIGAWSGSNDMDFEGSLDEVRFYKRSFSAADVSILYGEGNGDLGLTPKFILDVNNSAASIKGRVEFLKFGVPQAVSTLNPSDFVVSGGTLSNTVLNGSGYDFDFNASSYPALISIGLPKNAVTAGASVSKAASQQFIQSNNITAHNNLVLWYSFDEVNASMAVHDFSGNHNHGQVTGGKTIPGKFASSMLLDSGEYLAVDGERLSLTSAFTLSLWAKILDDGYGVLARNGQFSLQYNNDNTIRGNVWINNGWRETKSRLPSGEWVHYALTFNGSIISLYLDGKLVSDESYAGYLGWGDGQITIFILIDMLLPDGKQKRSTMK